MTKKSLSITGLLFALIALGGCSRVGEKSANMSVIYIATTALSLLLLAGYSILIRKKEPWFLVLFSAVAVVNVGYLSLSISTSLEEALFANRIAYLGSVFLPVSMLMIILKTCKINYKRWLTGLLLGISAAVFFIAASPGYLDIYYKEVSLVTVNGISVLEKVYGPLHGIYLYYLLGHFIAMIGIVIFARAKNNIKTSLQAAVLLFAVLVNIGVWLMEQLVKIDFEFLSVSYIVSELFLLGISLLVQDDSSHLISTDSKALPLPQPPAVPVNASACANSAEAVLDSEDELREKILYLSSKLCSLTPTEKEIYRLYLSGKRTKDAMAALNITENTLKYHNRNIYSKLGVKNRKELVEISAAAEKLPY